MKLAEALAKRNELKAQIQEVRGAAFASNTIQVRAIDDQPVTPPEADTLTGLTQMDALQAQFRDLVVAINRTNNTAQVPDTGLTVMEAIAQREYLQAQATNYKQLMTYARSYGVSGGKPDLLKIQSTLEERIAAKEKGIDVTDLVTQRREAMIYNKTIVSYNEAQKRSNEFAKQARDLDSKLQQANWTIDLVQ